MDLKLYLLFTIATTIMIGVTPIISWSPDIRRYESYDLERGPVFYEAYYPDSNDEAQTNYQEKRYFDRGPVLEKTYQIPSERIAYAENNIQPGHYQTRAENFPLNDDQFPPNSNSEAVDIKEISKLARRAISRDLENWNTLENYLDHAKYQDPLYGRRAVVPDSRYRIQESIRGIGQNFQDPLKQQRDPRRNLYEEIQEKPLSLQRRVQSTGDRRDSSVDSRLPVSDFAGREFLGPYGYGNQQPKEQEALQAVRRSNLNTALSKGESPLDSRSIMKPYPTENIFEPRPQVINYIFSRKPEVSTENNSQNGPERKEVNEPVPRNYGDNLIRDEMKKSEEDKDVKVTSIEVNEVPRHKTRHHHGEWPKRDYSHRHQK